MQFLQVCEAQLHFARQEEGEKLEMPHFGGQKGPEIARGLLEIENQFEKNLNILRNVKKTILDVKATSWHDDYNRLILKILFLIILYYYKIFVLLFKNFFIFRIYQSIH